MPDHLIVPYTATWATLTLATLVLAAIKRDQLALFSLDYLRFLAMPWKVATFSVALVAFVFLAPYTGDPTWDWVNATYMSVLCYYTAPWAVAVIYRAVKRVATPVEIWVAFIFWMFTTSWSYDIYLVWRDGAYPTSWYDNIVASGILYALGGLYWNVAVVPERGLIFAFMDEEWPRVEETGGFKQRALLIGFIMAPVVVGILWYVYDFVVIGGNI